MTTLVDPKKRQQEQVRQRTYVQNNLSRMVALTKRSRGDIGISGATSVESSGEKRRKLDTIR